jgi:hypothetical protein
MGEVVDWLDFYDAHRLAFDTQLHQPHDVREELVRRSASCGRINPSAMGFVKQGQGQ